MFSLLLLLPLAQAEDTVLVSGWQARNAEASAFAGLIEQYVARALGRVDGVRVLRLEDTPDFPDYPARIFMDGCPPGDAVGCTQVLAERGEAAYAVTGTVQQLAAGTRVEVDVIDVTGARVAVTFTAEVTASEDQVFAEGVAKVVLAVIQGEAGREVDIRERAEEDVTPLDRDAVAASLAELGKELGEAEVSVSSRDEAVPRSTYSAADVAREEEMEGSKEWERLGMSSVQWLHYKNSGLTLVEWRRRAAGRAGQLVLHGAGWFGDGPYEGQYYGRYAVGTSLEIVDSYAWQTNGSGRAAGGLLGVGWGLTPWLELGLEAGIATGHFTVDVSQQQAGMPADNADVFRFPAASYVVGPRAWVAPMPASAVRPVLGAGVDLIGQHASTEFLELGPSFHTFESRNVAAATFVAGGEARLSSRLDAFLHVPVQLLLAGTEAQTTRTGTVTVVDAPEPPAMSPVGFQLQLGVNVRLLGKDVEKSLPLDDDEP